MPSKINTKKKSSLLKTDRIWLKENCFTLTGIIVDAMKELEIGMTPKGEFFDLLNNKQLLPGKVRYMVEKYILAGKLPETLPNKIAKEVVSRAVQSMSTAARISWENKKISIDDPSLIDVKLEGVYK